jgi:hypothetical protein
MRIPCKVCCVGAGLAVVGAAIAGATLWWPQPEPVAPRPTPLAPAVTPHGTPQEVLASALQRLHGEALAHFHADPQNGLRRMPPVYEKVVKEWKTPYFSSGELDREEPIPFAKEMGKIHEHSVGEFLSPSPVQPENAAPTIPAIVFDGKNYNRAKKAWEAKSIDLIGLIKHETPVVYVSEKVAELERGDAAPTRALDEFELAGLMALQGGENLFGRSREGVIRLVGSVRAEASCLNCHHQKREGDLLGAFSYVLREATYAQLPWNAKRAK